MFITNSALPRWTILLGLTLLRVITISAQAPSWCSTDGESSTNETGLHFTIMPMGASIVYGLESSDGNGFRLGLKNLLEANGTQTTMIGTQRFGNMTDNYMEAYQAITIDQFNNVSYHSGAYNLGANIVLVLIGTNDCWYIQNDDGNSTDPRFGAGVGAASRFGALLGSIWTKLPDALVLASELPQNTNPWEDSCIQGFNAHLPTVVSDMAAKGQQVRLVAMYDVVPLDQLQSDGTHPTDYGYQLMAHQWYSAAFNATKELCVERAASTTSSASGAASVAASATSATSSSPSGGTSASGAGALLSRLPPWMVVFWATLHLII